jgi:hypothetical protein
MPPNLISHIPFSVLLHSLCENIVRIVVEKKGAKQNMIRKQVAKLKQVTLRLESYVIDIQRY